MPIPGRHRSSQAGPQVAPQPETVRLDPAQLARLFAAPSWLRDLGIMSWLVVGVGALIVGLVWLLGEVSTIAIPVILGAVLGAVAGPIVAWLERRGVPRIGGALIVLLLLAAAGVLVLLMVLGGLASESSTISKGMTKALEEVESWLKSLGITKTEVKSDLEKSIPKAGSALINGVSSGISGLASTATFVVFTFFSAVFILKDGPSMRRWIDGHLGIPEPIAHIATGDTIRALRQYFLGVTIVALFNAVLIGGGALIFNVPLPGTIFVVTFVGAYVPFLGAWIAGIFAVALALSTGNETDAIAMAVIALLANGILQQIVQPIAYGATLSLNPLVVLIATIAGGALFGMIGLVLSAPLVSAAAAITRDVAQARQAKTPGEGVPDAGAPPGPEPAPA